MAEEALAGSFSDRMHRARARTSQQYMSDVRNRWPLVLFVALAITALLGAWQLAGSATDDHEATATVLLRPSAVTEAIEGRLGTTEIERDLATNAEVAESDDVIALVEEDTGLSLADSSVSVDLAADGLLFIGVSPSPEDAALIANRWATIFVNRAGESRLFELSTSVEALEATFTDLEEERAETIAPMRAMQQNLDATVDPDRRSALIREIDSESDRIDPIVDRIDAELRSVSSDLADVDLALLRQESPLELTRQAAVPASTAIFGLRQLLAIAAAGLLGGLLVALVRVHLDGGVRSAEQIETMGVRVLSVVPEIGTKEIADPALAVELAPESAAAGQYHIARTALGPQLRQRADIGAPMTVAVVSAAQGDGRTSVAQCLVAALSGSGEDALLIGGHRQNPDPHELFVDRNRASVVVYDTAPIRGGVDSLDLAATAEATILVVRQGRSLEDVYRSVELVKGAGGHLLGAVFIDAKPSAGPADANPVMEVKERTNEREMNASSGRS